MHKTARFLERVLTLFPPHPKNCWNAFRQFFLCTQKIFSLHSKKFSPALQKISQVAFPVFCHRTLKNVS